MNGHKAANDRLSDAIMDLLGHSNASLPHFSDEEIAYAAKFQAKNCFDEYMRKFGKKRAAEILTLLARVYAEIFAELNNLLQKE